MAILVSSLDEFKKQFPNATKFGNLISYLEELLKQYNIEKLQSIELGNSHQKEILGKQIYTVEQHYETQDRRSKSYESHKRYIDIQCVLFGEEIIEVEDVKNLILTQNYDEEKDFMLYSNSTQGSLFHMKKGMIAILFPGDGHMPGLKYNSKSRVIKSVIKYSVDLV